MTKREAIILAIKDKLKGITGVSDDNVFRSRVTPLMKGRFPAVTVEFVTDAVLDEGMSAYPIVDWALIVRVGVFTRGEEPDSLADDIVQSVYLKMVEDRFLNGLSMDIQPVGVKNELYDGDKPIGVQFLDFRVRYRTQALDLST